MGFRRTFRMRHALALLLVAAALGCGQKALTPESVARELLATEAEPAPSEKAAAPELTRAVAYASDRASEENESVPEAASAEEGRRLYGASCVSCHGARGDPPWHTVFMGGVPDLSDAAYQESRTDQQLYAAVTNGVAKTRMRAFIELSDRERWSLIRYIRTLTASQNE